MASFLSLLYIYLFLYILALPAHIAFNFAVRSDPYAHLCPSVGVLCARFGHSGDWVGEFGFDRLNRIACEIDQRIGQLSEKRVEKVRTGHCYYTMACGILPEMAKNVSGKRGAEGILNV
jgi:hypothetical protein